MGMKFDDINGSAKKAKLEYIKIDFGTTKFRMVGEILPRYAYWKKLKNNKSIPIECLAFDRKLEKFTNVEKDWFKHYFPKDSFSWSYLAQAIDLRDGKLKMLGLKKDLFEQIKTAAKSIGDPTDIENGWDVIVDKVSTGDGAFNVKYTLLQLELKNRPLTEEERETIKDLKPIDEVNPRPTPEEQKAFIEKNWINDENAEIKKEESAADTSDLDEFEDDIPY